MARNQIWGLETVSPHGAQKPKLWTKMRSLKITNSAQKDQLLSRHHGWGLKTGNSALKVQLLARSHGW